MENNKTPEEILASKYPVETFEDPDIYYDELCQEERAAIVSAMIAYADQQCSKLYTAEQVREIVADAYLNGQQGVFNLTNT